MDPNLNPTQNPSTPEPGPEPAPAPEPTPESNPVEATEAATDTPANPFDTPIDAPANNPFTESAAQAEPAAPAEPITEPAPVAEPATPATPATPAAPTAAIPAAKKPLPKKAILFGGIGAAAILLIVLGILFIPKLFGNKYSKLAKETFSEDVLIAVEENDKYGYIDLKGKMKIAPQFYEANNFEGNYALVKQSEDDDHYVMIDKKGQIKLQLEHNDYAYYDGENKIWEIGSQLYDNNLKKILPAGKEIYEENGNHYIVGPTLGSGDYDYSDWDSKQAVELYNSKGKSVYKFETNYPDIEVAVYYDVTKGKVNIEAYCGLALEKEKSVIVNCDTGKVVKADINYRLNADDYTAFELIENYDTKGHLLVLGNKVVFESNSEDMDFYLYDSNDGPYYKIEDDDTDKVQYYLINKKQLTDTKPASTKDDLTYWERYTDYTIISCGSNDGLMYGKKQVVPCSYDSIMTPDILTYEYLKSKGKNYVIGRNDDTSAIINANNGKVVQTFDYDYLDFEDSSIFVGYKKDYNSDTYTVHNLVSGKTQMITASKISFYPLYFRAYNDGKYEYYNKDFKLIYTENN